MIAAERHEGDIQHCTTMKMILWELCTIFSQAVQALLAEAII